MGKIESICSFAAPLPMPGINTDIISPMKRNLHPCDLGHYAFEPIRYINGDGDMAIPDPSFPMNRNPYKNAQILLVGENFGCGSSRETAALGISLMGIRCIIGTSFGGIFRRNCIQRSILPISLPSAIISDFFLLTESAPFQVDLPTQRITSPDGKVTKFFIEQFQKKLLISGLDLISSTLLSRKEIAIFQEQERKERPWAFRG